MRVRVQAVGAQGLRASGGMLSLDKRPDPYVTLVLGAVSHKCAAVKDVEPLKFFAWPDAVKEFDVADETALRAATLVLHVKDSDLLMDRYIGGTSIPLGPLVAARQAPDELCKDRFFPLEFADEKFKKKKASGEVKLTITIVQDATPEATEPTPPAPTAVDQTAPQTTQPPQPEKPEAPPPHQPKSTEQPIATEAKRSEEPLAQKEIVTADARPNEPTLQSSSDTKPPDVLSPQDKNVQPLATASDVPEAQIEPAPTSNDVDKAKTASKVHRLRVELVVARDIPWKTSFIDRKPDPKVSIEFYGMTMSSVALNNVDSKKPVEWKDTILEFDLPEVPPPVPKKKNVFPMDLVAYMRDENLVSSTFIGAGKLDISDIFLDRNEASWLWRPSSEATKTFERSIDLSFADEKLTKKKSCGVLTVRLHLDTVALDTNQAEVTTSDVERMTVDRIEITGPVESAEGNHGQETVVVDSPTPVVEEKVGLAPNAPEVDSRKIELSSDIKMLSIELLCGRDLAKPSSGNVASSLFKAVLDRKPDPYAVLVLGSQVKKCPPANDVDVAFFEWKNAIQVFDFVDKPYPNELEIHIRDDDTLGKGPYMGGARLQMPDIWNEIERRATLNPPEDLELMKTVPLTFANEQLTKQKSCGQVGLRFRWVYSETKLPVRVADPATESPLAVFDGGQVSDPESKIVGSVMLKNISVVNNKSLIDGSFDLYVEASSTTNRDNQSSQENVVTTNVLKDATKGLEEGARVTWPGEELIIPVCMCSLSSGELYLRLGVKDKNAILKDGDVGSGLKNLVDHIARHHDKPVKDTLDLIPQRSKRSEKDCITIEFDIHYIPLESPLFGTSLTSGGILSVFLIRSEVKLTSEPTPPVAYTVQLDLPAQKKSTLLSFGKSNHAFTSVPCSPESDSVVRWSDVANILLSEKCVNQAKEKDSLILEIEIIQRIGKDSSVIGSSQVDIMQMVRTPCIKQETISFGKKGTMVFDFAVCIRPAKEVAKQSLKTKTEQKTIPSGNLHLLVLQAKELVSPDPKVEKSEDLDPEVRVAIEPRYIKRKDNPVLSMLKTKPLENAGAVPTWNEYLRLEYRLPAPPTIDPSSNASAASEIAPPELPTFPPPIVQVCSV
ncbi:hypothetical protein PINS_up010078 [Pythium insidiosum]|nr:hypothetical protein PINS_up010078 [Pythium insidiosum]